MLWNEEQGAWFDYDLINKKQRLYFTPTNLSPLYFGCFDITNKAVLARKILAYIDSTGIVAFPGGLPATVMHTGEQWDWPNGNCEMFCCCWFCFFVHKSHALNISFIQTFIPKHGHLCSIGSLKVYAHWTITYDFCCRL